MQQNKKAVKALLNKLQFNPVDLGGNTKYTTKLGIVLGAIVMVFVLVYAIGKFAVIDSAPNVVVKTFLYQNDPYELDLKDWNIRFSIFESISKQWVTSQNMLSLGLNVTCYNLEGEQLTRANPSSLIPYTPESNMLTIDNKKTPFVVSGSNYVHASPNIKEYLIEFQFCSAAVSRECSNSSNRVYQIALLFNPNWAYLENPKDPAVRQMTFNQKFTIDRRKTNVLKAQITYDVLGFNVTSDTSYLPSFIPRNLEQDVGSSLAAPPSKILLPSQSNSIGELNFRRSGNSQSYVRKFNSIDVIFAEILGVVALFGLILWILFAHYNSWGSEQYILNRTLGTHHPINLLQYLKFYLRCQKRSAKEEQVLNEVHQDIIEGYKERKRRKIQIEVLKLRVNKLENQLGIQGSQASCRQQILEKLEGEEKEGIFSSSILTEEIRQSLLKF